MFDEIEKSVKKLHPYEVPEIVAVKATNVNKAYMDCMLESTKKA